MAAAVPDLLAHDSQARVHGPPPVSPTGRPATGSWPARRPLSAEHGLVLLLSLLVLAVHDVGYLLSQSFWNDEDWVALTTRLPLSELPATTASTPIGWAGLLRLVSFGHGQSGRLLPLAFAAAAVIPGYWLARRLDWMRKDQAVVAGVLAGCAVLLVPAMLVRDDLKQYTADACLALMVLALTARLERQWSRAGLVLLSAAVPAGLLVSHTTAFAGAAAFAGIFVVQVARRTWARLAEATVAAAGAAILGLGIYEAFDTRALLPGLTAYWHANFPPAGHSLGKASQFVVLRFSRIHVYFGLGPAWLAVPLVLAGLMTIARHGRPATATAFIALWPEMLLMAGLHRYPFLDLRTSTFLITVTAVVAAIGVAGMSAALRARLRGRITGAAAVVLVPAVALAAFGLGARQYLRSHLIPSEDIRQQTQYVAAHAAGTDPIVVSASSNWGFGYYWPAGQPSRRPDPTNLQGYQAYFADQPRIIVARDGAAAAIGAAMAQALGQLHPGACARIWLVRSHVSAAERAAWVTVLHDLRLTATPVGDGGAYIQSGPRSCR
jgi:hypothetical protein